MGAENLIGLVVALALGVTAASLSPSRAQAIEDVATALAPHYQIVDECGGRFVELDAQPQPTEMTWGEFGAPIGSYYGVVAYAHGHDGDPRRENAGGLYQCTELAHRYLHDLYAIPTRIGLGLGNGVDLAKGLAERFGGQLWTGGITGATPVTLRYFADSTSACRPMVGSIVSIAMPLDDGTPTPGHVAIIRSLEPDGQALVATLFEQHGGSSLTPGDVFSPSHIRFERIDGAWTGAFQSPTGQTFPVAGWTSVVAP